MKLRTQILGICIGCLFVIGLLYQFTPKQSAQKPAPIIETADARSNQEQTSPGTPLRLMVPGITVDAAVEHVGLTPDKAMDVPGSISNVGWYKFGPKPGEIGSAVIAGHLDGKKGERGVFTNLDAVKIGDELQIRDDKGEIVSFVVREIRKYDQNADAADVFGSSDGKSHLNLITCEGVWNTVSKSYSQRLVVFADKK